MGDQRCSTCRFWLPVAVPVGSTFHALHRGQPPSIGMCRRYPPSAAQQSAERQRLLEAFREAGVGRGDDKEHQADSALARHVLAPRVSMDWWCGEWAAKAAP